MSSTGNTRGGALLLLAVAASLVSPAAAQTFDDERRYDPPLSLPETITGVVRPGSGQKPARVDRIREVFQAMQACWIRGGTSGYSGQEITLRLAFKRSGEVLGQPRITYYAPGGEPDRREAFQRSVREALERCSPLPFTPAFGAAVAGRPFTFRFSDTRPL